MEAEQKPQQVNEVDNQMHATDPNNNEPVSTSADPNNNEPPVQPVSTDDDSGDVQLLGSFRYLIQQPDLPQQQFVNHVNNFEFSLLRAVKCETQQIGPLGGSGTAQLEQLRSLCLPATSSAPQMRQLAPPKLPKPRRQYTRRRSRPQQKPGSFHDMTGVCEEIEITTVGTPSKKARKSKFDKDYERILASLDKLPVPKYKMNVVADVDDDHDKVGENQEQQVSFVLENLVNETEAESYSNEDTAALLEQIIADSCSSVEDFHYTIPASAMALVKPLAAAKGPVVANQSAAALTVNQENQDGTKNL